MSGGINGLGRPFGGRPSPTSTQGAKAGGGAQLEGIKRLASFLKMGLSATMGAVHNSLSLAAMKGNAIFVINIIRKFFSEMSDFASKAFKSN